MERLRNVYKDKALSQATVWRWLDRFKLSVLNEDSNEENIPLPCLQSIGDKWWSGRPLSALTPENKQKADEIIQANRRVTIDELSIDLDISVDSKHCEVIRLQKSVYYVGAKELDVFSVAES